MKLNYKRTIFVGFGFFLICSFWQAYDNTIPLILTNKFGMSQAWSGVIMALDNVLALFMLPLFGAISDKHRGKRGRRTPFIVVGTLIAAVMLIALSFVDSAQLRHLSDVSAIDDPAALEQIYDRQAGETLLTPTKIYVKSVLALLKKVDVKGISHITGGGFYENIPRSIPDGLCAKIDKSAVRVLPIFDLIAKTGNIPERDMFNTYNMGVGMSIVVPAAQVQTALDILTAHGEDAYVIGTIVKNDEEKVILE